MRYLLCLLAALALSMGCKNTTAISNGFGLGKIAALSESALKAKPSEPFKSAFQGIVEEVPHVKAQLETDAKVINTLNVENARKDEQVDTAKQEVKNVKESYYNRWVGDRTFREIRRLIIGFVLLLIAGAALSEFAVTRLIGKYLLDILNPFTYVRIVKGWWGNRNG